MSHGGRIKDSRNKTKYHFADDFSRLALTNLFRQQWSSLIEDCARLYRLMATFWFSHSYSCTFYDWLERISSLPFSPFGLCSLLVNVFSSHSFKDY